MNIVNGKPHHPSPPSLNERITFDPLDDLLAHHFQSELDPHLGQSAPRFHRALTLPRRARFPRAFLIAGSAVAASLALVLLLNAALRDHSATKNSSAIPLAIDADTTPLELERTFAWQTFDEGTVLVNDQTPMRKVRREVLERVQYYDPTRQALVEMTIPKEEVFLVGLNTY